ncbi:MAG TPA: hypothetical protein DCG79_05155, partial [Clostridiales bacterium]|nr:hypothetical protein [Clostridiales bacterium]
LWCDQGDVYLLPGWQMLLRIWRQLALLEKFISCRSPPVQVPHIKQKALATASAFGAIRGT